MATYTSSYSWNVSGWNEENPYKDRVRTTKSNDQRAYFLKAGEEWEKANKRKVAQRAQQAPVQAQQENLDIAKQYMDEWRQNMADVKGMYSKAIDYIEDPNFGGFQDLEKSVQSDLEAFRGTFGGLKTEAVDVARQQLGIQRGLSEQYAELAKADYEGVSGRAMQDVAAQAELGRQAEARRLQSLGIDPTSGRYRSMMRKSRMQEALGKAQAGTQARFGEKARVTDITGKGLQLIDPSKASGIATGIERQGAEYQQMLSGIKTSGASARAQAAGAIAGIGTGLARAGEPYAEIGGVHTGLAYQPQQQQTP